MNVRKLKEETQVVSDKTSSIDSHRYDSGPSSHSLLDVHVIHCSSRRMTTHSTRKMSRTDTRPIHPIRTLRTPPTIP